MIFSFIEDLWGGMDFDVSFFMMALRTVTQHLPVGLLEDFIASSQVFEFTFILLNSFGIVLIRGGMQSMGILDNLLILLVNCFILGN